MTTHQDSGGDQWRLARARALLDRAREVCGKGDLGFACALAADALDQLPLQLVKRHITWPTP